MSNLGIFFLLSAISLGRPAFAGDHETPKRKVSFDEYQRDGLQNHLTRHIPEHSRGEPGEHLASFSGALANAVVTATKGNPAPLHELLDELTGPDSIPWFCKHHTGEALRLFAGDYQAHPEIKKIMALRATPTRDLLENGNGDVELKKELDRRVAVIVRISHGTVTAERVIEMLKRYFAVPDKDPNAQKKKVEAVGTLFTAGVDREIYSAFGRAFARANPFACDDKLGEDLYDISEAWNMNQDDLYWYRAGNPRYFSWHRRMVGEERESLMQASHKYFIAHLTNDLSDSGKQFPRTRINSAKYEISARNEFLAGLRSSGRNPSAPDFRDYLQMQLAQAKDTTLPEQARQRARGNLTEAMRLISFREPEGTRFLKVAGNKIPLAEEAEQNIKTLAAYPGKQFELPTLKDIFGPLLTETNVKDKLAQQALDLDLAKKAGPTWHRKQIGYANLFWKEEADAAAEVYGTIPAYYPQNPHANPVETPQEEIARLKQELEDANFELELPKRSRR